MRTKWLLGMLTCILLTWGTGQLSAQVQEVLITSPQDSALNVPLSTSIDLETVFPIDSSSIVQFYRESDDSTAVWQWTTVTLVPKILHDSADADSTLQYYSIRGVYDLQSDTTLSYTPSSNLIPDTWSLALATSLSVVVDTVTGTGGLDTLATVRDSVVFKTAPDAHRVLSSSVGLDQWINCTDSLWVQFNRPLDSNETVAGPLAQIFRYDSVSVNGDTTYNVHTTEISTSTYVMSSDSSLLLIIPAERIPSESYRLQVNTHYLSGDTLNDVSYEYNVSGSYSVVIGAENSNPLGSTPSAALVTNSGEHSIEMGELLTFTALTGDSTFTFLRWDCPDLPGIHNSTNPKRTIVATCGTAENLEINAIFCETGAITLDVHDTTHMWVKVYQYDNDSGTFAYLGGEGLYSISVNERYRVVTGADSGSGMMFSEWKSNDDEYDGGESAMIDIHNSGYLQRCGGTIVLGPNFPFLEPVGPATCCLDISAEWVVGNGERTPEVNIPEVLTIINGLELGHNVNDPAITSKPCDANQQVTFSLAGCYEISDIVINDKNGNTIYEYSWTEGSGPSNWNSAAAPDPNGGGLTSVPTAFQSPRCMEIYIGIRPTGSRVLTVVAELEDARIITDGQIGVDKDVRVVAYVVGVDGKKRQIGITPNANTYSGLGKYEKQFTVEAYCGEQVELVAEYNVVESGYSFTGWSTDNPYQYPSPTTDESFTITLDANKSARAVFREHFRVRKVGFFLSDATDVGGNEPTYMPGLNLWSGATSDVNVWVDYQNETHYGSKVYFLFNDEPSTDILSGVTITERSERIDWPIVSTVQRNTRGSWGLESATVSQRSGEGYMLVMTPLTSGSVDGLVRGMHFDVQVSPDLENVNNEQILVAEKASLDTELPGIEIIVERIRALDYEGWFDDPDLYTMYLGAIGNDAFTDGNTQTDGRLPSETPEDIDEGVWQYYRNADAGSGSPRGGVVSGPSDYIVISKEKGHRMDIALLMLQSFDMDGENVDSEVNANWEDIVGEVLAIFAAIVVGYYTWKNVGTGKKTPSPFKQFLIGLAAVLALTSPAWVPIFANLLATIFRKWGGDARLGDQTYSFPWAPNVWFGAHPDAKSIYDGVNSGDAEYDIDFRIKR